MLRTFIEMYYNHYINIFNAYIYINMNNNNYISKKISMKFQSEII